MLRLYRHLRWWLTVRRINERELRRQGFIRDSRLLPEQAPALWEILVEVYGTDRQTGAIVDDLIRRLPARSITHRKVNR